MFHAAAKLLSSAVRLTMGRNSTGVQLLLWWKASPGYSTAYTVSIEATQTSPNRSGDQPPHGTFERLKETVTFIASVADFPYPPTKDEHFLAGYSATNTGDAVQKYIVTKVIACPGMSDHYQIDANLSS